MERFQRRLVDRALVLRADWDDWLALSVEPLAAAIATYQAQVSLRPAKLQWLPAIRSEVEQRLALLQREEPEVAQALTRLRNTQQLLLAGQV